MKSRLKTPPASCLIFSIALPSDSNFDLSEGCALRFPSMESSHLRETLNRRARSLALLRPLFDLETNKGRYADMNLEAFDLFRFISAVLDVIITEMGVFQRGATYEQILAAVVTQLRKVE